MNYERIESVNTWIDKTVDASWRELAREATNPREVVQALRRNVAQSEGEIVQRISNNYISTLNSLNKSVDSLEWYKKWDNARIDGEKHSIPEVQGQLAISRFLQVIRKVSPSFASTHEINLASDPEYMINKKPVSLKLIGEAFQKYTQIQRSSGTRRGTGVFSTATHRGRPANQDDGFECPCLPDGEKHYWDRNKCEVVLHCLFREAFVRRKRVSANLLQECRKRLREPKWKAFAQGLKKARATKLRGTTEQAKAEPMDEDNHNDDLIAILAEPAPEDDNEIASVDSTAFVTGSIYPLFNSTIFDRAAGTHLVNDKNLLYDVKPADSDDYLLAGTQRIKVVARGKRRMEGIVEPEKGGEERRSLILDNVAYVPNFHTNIVSGFLLWKKLKIWHLEHDKALGQGSPTKGEQLVTLIPVSYMFRQIVIEYKPLSSYLSSFQTPQVKVRIPRSDAAVFILPTIRSAPRKPRRARKRRTTRDERAPRRDPADLWHLRAGHVNDEALKHLIFNTRNVRFSGPIKKRCTHCRQSDAHREISRRPSENRSKRPFWRICLGWFRLGVAYNGHEYALVITDEYTGVVFIYTMNHPTNSLETIVDFEAFIERQFGLKICRIRMDNQRGLISTEKERETPFETWTRGEGIIIETAPNYTHEPNGTAERYGQIIQSKSRKMKVAANLPDELWTEIWTASGYLHNRTPSERNGSRPLRF